MSLFARRDSGSTRLEGMRADDGAALGARLRQLGRESRLIAADLTLGAWRNHHVASEILAELERPDAVAVLAAAHDADAADVAALPAQSDVGRRIDRETAGERIVIEAFALATDVVRAVGGLQPATFCILVGRHGLGWEPADELFVRFLAHALRSTGHRLVLVAAGAQDPDLPDDWAVEWSHVEATAERVSHDELPATAVLVPGILTPQITSALDIHGQLRELLIPLSGGCFLVPPVLRVNLDAVPDGDFERFALATKAIPWLSAFGSYHERSGALGATGLWTHARQDFEAGGLAVPIRLLERAVTRARNASERGVFTVLAQAARIVSRRFEAAARVDDPDDGLAPELRQWLWHTKGWALTMLDRPEEGESCLARARDLLRTHCDTDEYLYLLNISALNRLKAGHWEAACELERQIRSRTHRIASGQPQVRYINSLNFARLYRLRGDWDESDAHYRDAFGTARGVRSDSDAIYLNVCLAKLNEARRRPAEALDAWARAALAWASSPLPEAIAARVVAAIRASGAPERASANALDDVAAILTSKIVVHEPAIDSDRAPSFVRFEECPNEIAASATWNAVRLAGTWVLGADVSTAPTIDSDANRRLRSVLACLGGHEREFPRTIVVDEQCGLGPPESDAALLSVALRLGIRSLRIGTGTIDLDEGARRQLEGMLRVRRGSAVASVVHVDSGAIVMFNRYRQPRGISLQASEMLRRLDEHELSVAAVSDALPSALRSHALPLLRLLERERIVELHLPESISGATFIPATAGAAGSCDP